MFHKAIQKSGTFFYGPRCVSDVKINQIQNNKITTTAHRNISATNYLQNKT